MPASLNALLHRHLGPHGAQLARGLAAFGSAEMLTRIVRLATTVIIARQLTPTIVGEAALALTIFELVRVLERVGTGQQIVTASPERLSSVCNTVQRIYWAWTAILVVFQLGVAAFLGLVMHLPLAGQMLAVLTAVWPFMANGHVQYYLALRDQQMGKVARIAGTQAIVDQLLTMAMLLNWASPWSIVLPKLLTAPLWLIMARHARPWHRRLADGFAPPRAILRYGATILLADAMTALRTQGDNLVIAATLGTPALGTYYFAFNAGLGIATSIINAFGTVAFPMLSATPAGPQRMAALKRTLWLAGVSVVPLIALQSLAAPWYVPVVFGAHWAFAAPLISILCLGGIPLLATQMTSAWLRAEGQAGHDASAWTMLCLMALGGLSLGAFLQGLTGAAIGLVAGQALASVINAALHLRRHKSGASDRPAFVEP